MYYLLSICSVFQIENSGLQHHKYSNFLLSSVVVWRGCIVTIMNEPVTLITQPKINWNKCVICQKDGATKNFTDKSWETLRNAANTRQDDILLKLSMFFEQEPRGI